MSQRHMDAKEYVGTKRVLARPMSRGDYNVYRGWEVPADEDPADDGFLVEYIDGGKSNHPAHEGYISWSPKDVFERAYVDASFEGFVSPEPPHFAGTLGRRLSPDPFDTAREARMQGIYTAQHAYPNGCSSALELIAYADTVAKFIQGKA